MNDFLKLVKESGIIQQIRELVPSADREKFDEMVQTRIKEENDIYLKVQEKIILHKQEVKDEQQRSKSESEG